MGNFINLLTAIAKWSATHKKEIIKGTANVAVLGVSVYATYKLTQRKYTKIYKQLQEQHDKETARRLANEFQKKYEILLEEAERAKKKEKEIQASIINLCNTFGIDPNIVLP